MRRHRSLNDYSAVLWLGYGRIALSFSGDAERTLSPRCSLPASICPLTSQSGHHGSNTSTTESFAGVSPTYGVIMVGRLQLTASGR